MRFQRVILKRKIEDSYVWNALVGKYYKPRKANYVFFCVKRTFYFGDGTTEEALDCLYLMENFFFFGIYFENNWMAKLDFRISDNFSEWNENSYDPYGVGYSGSSSFEGIPDPKIQISVRYSF